jgi:hypothetical protein
VLSSKLSQRKRSALLQSAVRRNCLIACFMAVLLAACAPPNKLAPVTTDGCSLFPNRSPFGEADWCHCCVAHDLIYWRGGTEEARLDADRVLAACVRKASGSALLANVMFAGVRVGGTPYLPTWFRWGYGWPFGRSYGLLTPQEEVLASSLGRDYRAGNPALACPDRISARGQQQRAN